MKRSADIDYWAGFVHGFGVYFLLQLTVAFLVWWWVHRTKERT